MQRERLKLKGLLRKLVKKRGARRGIWSLIAAKRARVSAVFSDSQVTAIVEFVKDHSELCDKENARFHDRHRKEALWSEIAEE